MSRSAGLAARLDALEDVVRLGSGRLPADVSERAGDLLHHAGARLRLSGEHTVVALAGATGSGKSSLFNAVAQTTLSPVGIRRPTTSATQAFVVGGDGADGLLDWLGVGQRHYAARTDPAARADPAAASDLAGLVLLDLPDHDSTEQSHRAEVDRLVRLVDAFVWVLDPQKYADAAVHDRYLRPLSAHREVVVVTLNQADQLDAESLQECLADLRELLVEDGLAGIPVLATSATTPGGAQPLRQVLVRTVTEHRARTERIGADLTGLASSLLPLVPNRRPTRSPGSSPQLATAMRRAAGVPTVLDAVVRAHTRRGTAAVGWPPLRWLSRLRPDPLRRLGLGRSGPSADQGVLSRTSMPAASAASRAGVDSAIRQAADTASTGLPGPWPTLFRAAAARRADEVPDALDRAVGGADLGMSSPPRWWRAAGAVQWALLGLAVVGLLWLGLLAVLGYLQIDLEPPALGPFAWPTLLLIGGLLAGLLLRVAARPFIALGAARRRRRAARELTRRVDAVTEELILAPLRAEVQVGAELSDAVRGLAA